VLLTPELVPPLIDLVSESTPEEEEEVESEDGVASDAEEVESEEVAEGEGGEEEDEETSQSRNEASSCDEEIFSPSK